MREATLGIERETSVARLIAAARTLKDRPFASGQITRESIGIVGTPPPEEIVLAAGGLLHTILAQPNTPTSTADKFLAPEETADIRSLLDQLARPTSGHAPLALIGPPYAGLAVTVEELRRSGAIPAASPTAYFELPLIRKSSNRLAARITLQSIMDLIGVTTGQPATGEKLAEAVRMTNARRELLRAFAQQRRVAPSLPGALAFDVLLAASSLAPEVCVPLLSVVVAEHETYASDVKRPRLLLISSSPLADATLHDAVDAAGGVIVAEDDPRGSRAAAPPIAETGDLLDAILDHYFSYAPAGTTYPSAHRLWWLNEELAKGSLEGVVVYGRDDRFGWDVPAIQLACDQAGVALVFVRTDVRTAKGMSTFREAIEPFCERLSAAGRQQ